MVNFDPGTGQNIDPDAPGLPATSDVAMAAAETLPAWTYDNAEFFALERERLFMCTWQIVGHVSDVAKPGDYVTLDMLGERAVVVHGRDGKLRAFYNVCRHRAARVLAGDKGTCSGRIVCPYHGWNYDLDGKLKAVPAETSFPGLDKAKLGLVPLALDVAYGFLFVRFAGSGPSMAEVLEPLRHVLEPYRIADLQPLGSTWWRQIDVDWKNAMDNYLEGYHVPVGHPGLMRMFGPSYRVATYPGGVSLATAEMRDRDSNNWSERAYQHLLPEVEHLPESMRWTWQYVTWFPNSSIELYPEQVAFFQVIPDRPGKCWARAMGYGLPTEDRAMKAARFVNWRINDQVQAEDEQLVFDVQEGLKSRTYSGGYLSEKEVALRQFHDLVRGHLPVAWSRKEPTRGTLESVDRAMAAS